MNNDNNIRNHARKLLVALVVLGVTVVRCPAQTSAPGAEVVRETEESMKRNYDDRDPSISFVGAGWQQFAVPGTTHHRNTATSSSAGGDSFTLAHTRCTRLVWWATRSNDRGRAEVTIDGQKPTVVDQRAAALTDSVAVFDSGPLPLGQHRMTVRVVGGGWVECDRIEITTDARGVPVLPPPMPCRHDDRRVGYYGPGWTVGGEPPAHRAERLGALAVLSFFGSEVRCIGPQGPDQGLVEVQLDGKVMETVDTFASEPKTGQTFFVREGLDAQRQHCLILRVLGRQRAQARGAWVGIEGFVVSRPVDAISAMAEAARAEVAVITAGTKAYLAPKTWKPVAYAARAPERGVTLEPGAWRTAWDRNLNYLKNCAARPIGGNWVQNLPASSEGRMLGGAGHALRWGERAELRRIVDDLVAVVAARQTEDGYCLPYDRKYLEPSGNPSDDERRNYDRVNLTRGLLAAGRSGNAEAYRILRRFYDFLNRSPVALTLLSGPHAGSGHNVNNGHAGWPMMYLSPVGKPEDLVMAERVFVQDFFLEQARLADPRCLGWYPLHVPHSYVLLAFESWLDHYRATGAAKYLEASLGAWDLVHRSYEHVGGTIAICEERHGSYPPNSLFLHKHTGETCGSVFWADFNHRLLQLFPSEERYAAEIEQVICNVLMAAQDPAGNIRYHNHLDGRKDRPQVANTCCEVMGVPFVSRMPEFIYALANDGLWVNQFTASTVTWSQGGSEARLTQETAFPDDGRLTLRLKLPAPATFRLRLRIPAWTGREVSIAINGQPAAAGKPGSHAVLDRRWSDGDRIELELPLPWRLAPYTGVEQHPQHPRAALMRGPILMALVGANDLDLSMTNLTQRLRPDPKAPRRWIIEGLNGPAFVPYADIKGETFTCFPTWRSHGSHGEQ